MIKVNQTSLEKWVADYNAAAIQRDSHVKNAQRAQTQLDAANKQLAEQNTILNQHLQTGVQMFGIDPATVTLVDDDGIVTPALNGVAIQTPTNSSVVAK